MNRNQIKYIAATAMLIDHIAAFFIPEATFLWYIMRIAGRLTAPIMCFFLAEGFRYTSSRKKYGLRLFTFSIISQFAYAFAHGFSILTPKFNMIFTLFLCFIILLVYENVKNNLLKTAIIFSLILVSVFSDWGIVAPLWVLSFYILNNDSKNRIIAFIVISFMQLLISIVSAISNQEMWFSQLWQLGILLFIPVLFCYKNKSSKQAAFSKWFFYIFYPMHLIAIGIINRI